MGLIIGCRCEYHEGFDWRPEEFATEGRDLSGFCKGCYANTTSRYYPGPLKCLEFGSEEAVAIDEPTIWTGDGDAVDYQWSGVEGSTTGRTLVQVGKKKFEPGGG